MNPRPPVNRIAPLILVAVLGLLSGCKDDGGRHDIETRLRADPRVDLIGVEGFWELDSAVLDSFSLVSAAFRLRHRPDSLVGIKPSPTMFTDTPHLRVLQIGGYSLHAKAGHEGNPSGADFGYEGDFVGLLPVEIRSLDDLINHYDAFERLVAGWPDYPERATATNAAGDTVVYYREKLP